MSSHQKKKRPDGGTGENFFSRFYEETRSEKKKCYKFSSLEWAMGVVEEESVAD